MSPGRIHVVYVEYLALQAIALVLWWPKASLARSLDIEDGPDTLLAVLIAVGVTVSYHALRSGAEEILAPDQSALREWAIATQLGIGRIVRGSVVAGLAQIGHLLLLSSPLVVIAAHVAGGGWGAVGWGYATVAAQALFYRQVAALVYLRVGHHREMTFFGLRIGLVAGYAAGIAVPFASHPAVMFGLLGEPGVGPVDVAGVPGFVTFIGLYLGLALAVAAMLYRELRGIRAAHAPTTRS